MQISTPCAICNSLGNFEVIYESTVDSSSFTPEIFSARRIPDRKYYQGLTNHPNVRVLPSLMIEESIGKLDDIPPPTK